MLPSLRLALNTLTGKRGRTILLIGAVTVAASLVVAVGCTISSVQAMMEQSMTRFLGKADARIIHSGRGRFDDAIVDAVAQWPGVDSVHARLGGAVTLVHSDRRRDDETGKILRTTTQATGLEDEFNEDAAPFELTAGRFPTAPDEIVIGSITADELNAAIGDELAVDRFGAPILLKVVGTYERKKIFLLQRPRIYMDRATLAEASGHDNQISLVLIDLADDVVVDEFCATHEPDVEAPLALEPAELARSGMGNRLNANRTALVVSSVMTFISAAFIIVTGLTSSVTERQRELSVIRCLGGARKQLFASQLFVGMTFGTIGAILGIPLGLGLSALLVAIFRDTLTAGLQIDQLSLILAVIGSLCSGLLGALYPALMVSRITPLQALAVSSRPPTRAGILTCSAIGAVFVLVQPILLLSGDRDFQFWSYLGAGLPLMFIGYFLLATPILLILTRILGRPIAALLRIPRDMLVGSIEQTPYRNGLVAGALMIGMMILVSQWTQTKSLLKDWIEPIRFADAFAYRSNGISPEQQHAIESLPFVTESCSIGYLPLRVIDQQIFGVDGIAPRSVICIGFDPDVFFRMNHIEWIQGDPDAGVEKLKTGNAILVAERFGAAGGINVGDSITLGMGSVEQSYEIVGIVNSAGLEVATQLFGIGSQYAEHAMSCVFMDFTTVRANYDNHDTYIIQVNLADDITDEEATERVNAEAPGVAFVPARWITDTIDEMILAAFTVQSTIAFSALLLASVGVGNVLLAAILSRRYEFGLLRAMGAQRETIDHLVYGEAILLALAGALTGTLLGLHMAGVGLHMYLILAGIELTLHIPWLPIAVGWTVMIVMTMLASAPALIRLRKMVPGTMVAGGRTG